MRNSRAVFSVNGSVAARTAQRDLSAVAAERVFIGLGRVSKKTEAGVMLVRSAGATGAAPMAVGGGAAGGAGGGAAWGAQPGALLRPRPRRCRAQEVKRADFETGNLSQWAGVQRVAADRIQVVKSPVRQGGYAGRFEVRNGDNPVDSNDRAEVSLSTGEAEGDEDWYAWSAMFDPSFPTLSGFQLITQWHTSLGGSPAMGVYVEGNDLLVQVNRFSGTGLLSVDKIWRGPLPRGRWLDMKFHIKWSSSDSAGWIEFWADGVRQTFDDGTQRRYIRNLKPGRHQLPQAGLLPPGGPGADRDRLHRRLPHVQGGLTMRTPGVLPRRRMPGRRRGLWRRRRDRDAPARRARWSSAATSRRAISVSGAACRASPARVRAWCAHPAHRARGRGVSRCATERIPCAGVASDASATGPRCRRPRGERGRRALVRLEHALRLARSRTPGAGRS